MKKESFSHLCINIILLLFLFPGHEELFAQWSNNPAVNNPISTAANEQQYPAVPVYGPCLISDGSGGAITAWFDYRNAIDNNIYAQRINAAGIVQWTANGAAVCSAANSQDDPTIIPDGSGGAIMAWIDYRSGTDNKIYAQRINGSGTPLWTANGVLVCTAANSQLNPIMVPDGSGGAIITWYDYRVGINSDIYAQRINASGTLLWSAGGTAICTAVNNQVTPYLVSDGSGGAVITWQDRRSGTDYDIYAQRVNASGVPQWVANGVAVCTASGDQLDHPSIISNGSGGAIITWVDFRSGINTDIYSQLINAAGIPQWTANGTPICSAANDQYSPIAVSDGSGGAILTWQDIRTIGNSDIYAQRINAAGSVQWAVDGITVCGAASWQGSPALVQEGSGAVITWGDYRSGNNDIYAQKINASGNLQWTANGIAVSTPSNDQEFPKITTGSCGVIISWKDRRGGIGNDDIYAQMIDCNGNLQSGAPSITVNPVNPLCSGGSNGSAAANPSGCFSPYTYLWNTIPSQTSQTATGLSSGNYTVTVANSSGCTNTQTVAITQPSALTASMTTTSAICGGSNGTASVTANGGTSGYTYNWSPSGGNSSAATGLSAGNYTCTITDANGCAQTAAATITSSGGPTANATQTNISCNGGGNGSASVTASGGTSPYTYSWSPSGGSSSSATGLSAGTYTYLVTDANGCTRQQTVTITQPSALTATAMATAASCGSSNGSASVTALGGTGGLTYSWSPSGGNSSTATGLSSGNYTCAITDANSCTKTATVAVTQAGGPTVAASSTPQTCAVGGTAVANPSGGSAPYTYQWCNGASTSSATGLSAGTCTVMVTDANGCSTAGSVTITSSGSVPTANVTSTSAACGNNNGSATATVIGGTSPYTYQWNAGQSTSAITGLSGGSYTVTITDATGCTAVQTVNVSQTSAVTATAATTPAACGNNNGTATASASGGASPYTYNWNNGQSASAITGLSGGSYTVTITDATGCTAVQAVNISQTPGVTATAVSTPAACNSNNGTATATAGGGTSPYTYLWNPSGQTTSTVTGLSAGTHTVIITDAAGCTKTSVVSVAQTGGPTAAISGNLTIAQGQTATLTASGGGTYQWSSGSTQNQITVSPSAATVYCVTVTDAGNCTDSACLTVSVIVEPAPCGNIFIPNAFSPNNNGPNDIFYIRGNCISEMNLVIYNRWGQKVFESSDQSKGWNGIFKGKVENTGVFVWHLDAVLVNGDRINRKGNVSLLR